MYKEKVLDGAIPFIDFNHLAEAPGPQSMSSGTNL